MPHAVSSAQDERNGQSGIVTCDAAPGYMLSYMREKCRVKVTASSPHLDKESRQLSERAVGGPSGTPHARNTAKGAATKVRTVTVAPSFRRTGS